MKCPKCECELEITKVAEICPNCSYTHIKKMEWKGETTPCPKCSKKARVFKSHGKGRTFICDSCEIEGRYIDEEEMNAQMVLKDSELGKKLEWLFHIPAKIFHHNNSKNCPHCHAKKICDAHNDEVVEFCESQNIDVYVSNEYIEIIHKSSKKTK